jgi:uncharacterized phage protein (predicted DNA packaging)
VLNYLDDDDYIESLILASSIYIESCVGNEYLVDEKMVKLADLLQSKLISDMYENRGTIIAANSKKDIIVTTILDKLSNFYGGE